MLLADVETDAGKDALPSMLKLEPGRVSSLSARLEDYNSDSDMPGLSGPVSHARSHRRG